MIDSITVQDLFDNLQNKLRLHWIGGIKGKSREIKSQDPEERSKSLLGHLNFIHPNAIQILGTSELDYLQQLGKNSRSDALAQLFSEDIAVVIMADGIKTPEDLMQISEAKAVPLMTTPIDSHKLITDMRYLMSDLLAENIIIHGVFMEVMGSGVLLTGESNIGKSELALELISRGHRLIADDAPEFTRIAPDIVKGTCPTLLREFLEVRGLGVLNIRAMFGDSSIKPSKYLRLIIKLMRMDEDHLDEIDRLRGCHTSQKILGIDIPEITIPVAPGRNIAVAVETAVRNHILRTKGYDAAQDFIERQQEMLDKSKK